MIKSPQRIGVIPYVLEAFRDIGIFKDRFESLATIWSRNKGRFSKDQDVDKPNYFLWVNKNSNKGNSAMSAKRIPFEI